MATFQNNPFPNVQDYSSYQSWNKVTMPDGRVLYEIPGNPGYVFDPVISAATGKKTFRVNPRMQIDAAEQERQAIESQRKQAEYQNSPLGQVIPAAGSLGGIYLASKLAQGGSLFGGGAGAGATTTTALPSVSAVGGGASGAAATGGSLTLPVASVPSATGASGAAVGGLGSMLGSAGGLGALGGIGLGVGLGGQAAFDMARGKEASIPGRVVLGMATGGLSELARPFLAKKSTKEIEKGRWKGTGLEPEKYQQMIGKDYFAGTGGEQSRDEKFLTADAIRFNPDNYNNVKDWDTWDKNKQDTFLNAMLQAGKVREKKGGIYYDDEFAKQLADKVRTGAPANQPTPQVRPTPNTPLPPMMNPQISKALRTVRR